MRKTSTCPSCQEPVTLVEVPPATLVECPLCLAQFELAEALDFVAEWADENGPPELVVIELREASPPGEEPDLAAAEHLTEVQESHRAAAPVDASAPIRSGSEPSEAEDQASAETPVQVRCPCCRESFALADLLLADRDEPLGPEAASAILADGAIRPSDPQKAMSFRFGAGPAVDHSDFRLESVEARPNASVEAFEFAAPVGGNGGGKTDGGWATRGQRERGGLKDLIGAVVGGAAGLIITYYLLNLLGGPRFDMLRVYLPGVKHTAVHRPDWLGGPPEDEFDSGIDGALARDVDTPEPVLEKPATASTAPSASVVPPAGTEPAGTPTVEPVPAAETLPADYVGPLDPPKADSDDFGRALREVDRLAKAGPLTEEGYEAWCRLAVPATFIPRNDGNPQTQPRLEAMQRLLKALTLDDVKTIGRLATERVRNADRTSRGVLLVGTALDPNTPNGKGFVTDLDVAETRAQVVMAHDQKLPIGPNDRILVLGYVVDRPQDTTQGLETELPQIIWVRRAARFGG